MKEYKTLYQRLKDEYRVKLIENKNKWQYLAQVAEEALNENKFVVDLTIGQLGYICDCLLYTSPSPRDRQKSRMPSSA